MLKIAALIAATATVANARVFFWNKNNDFNTAYNWEVAGASCAGATPGKGCPTIDGKQNVNFGGSVTIPDADACSANTWKDPTGRVMKVNADVGLTSLILPTTGKIILGEDITMTFEETGSNEVSWSCKDQHSTSFKCGDNWNLGGFDAIESAHEVPCHEDTVVFPDDSHAIQVHVPPATFVKEVKILAPSGADPKYALSGSYEDGELPDQEAVKMYIKETAGQFEGTPIFIEGGEVSCGKHCAATCTNNCGAKFAAETKDGMRELADGRMVTDDEWQRGLMHEAQKASLAKAEAHKKSIDAMVAKAKGKYAKFTQDKKLGTARNTKALLNGILGDLNDGLPIVAMKNGTVYDDALEKSDSWAKELTKLLNAVGGSASNIENIKCKANDDGEISCSGFAGVETTEGESLGLLHQLSKAIKVFFGAMEMEPFKVPEISTKVGDVEAVIEFSYADADFALSPYSSAMGGFLSKQECTALESSMTYERANEMTDAFGKASTEVQGQFWEFVTGMVGATSMFEIDAIEWDKPPYAVDPTDRSRRDGHLKQIGHSYSPAVLRVEVQLSVVGGEALFDPASLTQPLAYGAYGADATLLTVDALKVIAESFSTITTTTVRTTLNVAEGAEIAGLVIDNVTVSGIEALRLEKASLEKLLADLRGRLATAGLEINKAKAAKDLACLDWKDEACAPAKDDLAKAYDAYNKLALEEASKAGFLNKVNASLLAAIADAPPGSVNADGSPAASSGEDEGMDLVPIIAAAAGAIVLILIIVVVILATGSSDGGNKADANRNVVAFENPMYDDPNAGGGAAAGAYGAAAVPDADPGLYDEPAFQAEDKSNPMYSSQDNLNGDGQGYLDVQPDDDDDDDDDDEDDESDEESDEDDDEDDE